MKDVDLAAAYQDIFTDAAKSDINSIIQNDKLELPTILLDLMTVGCKAPQDHLLEINEERIEARRQSSFWTMILVKLDAFGTGTAEREKLQTFEHVIQRLVDNIVAHLTLPSVDLFMDMNVIDQNDEVFDAFFDCKRDLGKLLRKITTLMGFERCFNLLMARLEQEILLAKEHPDKPVVWVNIHGVLMALE